MEPPEESDPALTLESRDWDDAHPEDRLPVVLALTSPPDWFHPRALETLVEFRPIDWHWSRIKAHARQQGVAVRDLQKAVDRLWSLDQPARAPRVTTTRDTGTTALLTEEDAPWIAGLSRVRGSGEAKETFNNLVLALESLTPWDTESWFDVVRHQCMIGGEPLSEQRICNVARAIEQQAGIGIHHLGLVEKALRSHCRNHPHDLLQEWLEILPPWDGTSRLTEWLADHAGVAKTAYTMEVSRLLPVSMVARALHPGIQCRSVVIFEGEQNIGKSKLLKTLAGEPWYREVAGTLEGKEAHMLMKGTWVVELSEMDVLSRTEDTRIRSFVTMCNDEYVPKYANDPVKLARRTILAGTINPEGDGSYLRDQTGATRYFPVKVGAVAIEDVAAIREQLFAEAMVWFHAHQDTWWHMSPAAEEELALIREMRRKEGVFEGPRLHEWLGKVQTGATEVTSPFHTEDALRYCFNIPPERWTAGDERSGGEGHQQGRMGEQAQSGTGAPPAALVSPAACYTLRHV